MSTRVFAALTALCFMLAQPVWADFDAGVTAFESEDFDRALKELEPLARAGRTDAMLFLARTYDEGLDAIAEALPWYSKAAAKGNARAQTRMGELYDEGLGVEQDTDLAMDWYAKAAAQGDDEAQLALGLHYTQDLNDNASALKLFREAAEQGNPEAQYQLGLLYLGEPGVARNVLQAWLYLSLAADTVEEAAQACDVLELEMKAAEVQKAQQLLEAWQKSH